MNELLPKQQAWIEEAKKRIASDKWYQRSGFHRDVHPKHVGFYVDPRRQAAFPVIRTTTGLWAVHNDPKDRIASNFAIRETDVLPLE